MGFKSIPEYPEYLVNDLGDIFSTKSNKILSTWVTKRQRVMVTISVSGMSKHLQVSRLVCRVHGNLPSLDSILEVDHIDSNTFNNYGSNLNALTKKEHERKTHNNMENNTTILCSVCGTINKSKTSHMCMSCYSEATTTPLNIDDIIYWVVNFSWARASRELGISDNGLRKRYRNLTGKDPRDIKVDNRI